MHECTILGIVVHALRHAASGQETDTARWQVHLFDSRLGPVGAFDDAVKSSRCKDPADRGRGSRPILIVLVI